MAFKLRNPVLPFTPPEGLTIEGKVLKIKGHIPDQAQRFAVNLLWANDDIAFHFNPRFDEGERPVVVCNTKDGCWGEEERPSEMPFKRNASFKMTVIIRRQCYQVYVDGRHFLEYQRRFPTKDIRTLNIEGDIDLKKVTLKDIPEYLPGEGRFC